MVETPFGEAWIQVEIARRLDSLAEEPEHLHFYDANGDGRLSDDEWEVVRSIVTAEVCNDARSRRQRLGLTSADDTSEIPVATDEELNPQKPDDGDITGEWHLDDLVEVDEAVREEIAGRYTILRELGKGSQGKTYLGRDLEGTRFVAIKELSFARLDDWKALELFHRESKLLGQLDHLGIPRFVEAFHVETEAGPRFFLVQQYIEGDNLQVRLKRGERFDEKRALKIARGLLKILVYLQAFSPPIVHRDIKPANIIERPGGRLALVDFGAVLEVVHPEMGGSTVVGTTGYMPPEQLMGRAHPSSDLFGLGTTLVHLLTRHHPTNLPVSRMRLMWSDRVHVSDGFEAFIDCMISPALEDRYASAAEALRALDEVRRKDPKTSNAMVVAEGPALPLVHAPSDSFITIERTDDRMVVRFPGRTSNDTVIAAALCGAAMGGYIVAFFLLGVSPWYVWPILFPAFGIALLIVSMHTSSQLTLDRKWGWKVERQTYGVKKQAVGTFGGIGFEGGTNGAGRRIYLVDGDKRHAIADELRADEREWVLTAVQDFIDA